MKIQIVSDLHLEFRGKDIYKILIPSAPILCMVGDICVCGSYTDFNKFINFLNHFTTQFVAIIHVAGNHEYYTAGNASVRERIENTMPEIDKKLKELNKRYSNYHYLNNNSWTYKDKDNKEVYTFIGSTLWTYIPSDKNNKHLSAIIETRMNDYNYIYMPLRSGNVITARPYTVKDMQKKHKLAVMFLLRAIKNARLNKMGGNTKYILLTHHKPLFDSNTDLKNEFTYAYENNLANTLLVRPIILAAHGHTHVHYDRRVNGVRVVSNPKGYIGENTKFNDKFIVNI
jgi:predicted phosphodiesterase